MTFPLPAQPPVYDEYEQHRTQEGMYRSDSLDAWIVSSFEMCQAVEEDEAHFARTDHPEVTTPEEYALIERMQGGPRSLQLIKGVLRQQRDRGLAESLDYGLALSRLMNLGDDADEGIAAFREKRTARFEGR